MANRLILKRSSVAGKVPLATDLSVGELAVNLADAKLYSKDAGGNVISVGGGSGSAGWAQANVKAATTTNITLSGTQTIDGIALVAGDRVLVKDQTPTSANGIYVVSATAWSRASDADTAAELAGAVVGVDSGTTNGGVHFDTDFKSTDTLGTTAVTFSRVVDATYLGSWVGSTSITTLGTIATGTWNASTISVAKGGTGATTLTGLVYGNGTSAMTAATAAQIVAAIGTTAVANATNADTLDSLHSSAFARAGAGGSIVEMPGTISANYSITSGSNGMSAGPISVANGVTVTVPNGSTWVIV